MELTKVSCRKGITLIELVVGLGVFSMILLIFVPGLKSFFTRMEIENGLRGVTAALSTARYNAIMLNRSVKVTLVNNRIVLKKKRLTTWEEFKQIELEKNVTYSINALPVFSPTGSIAPLCSIFVKNSRYSYKISVSMAGQFKTYNLQGN